ncbi:MAG TPA: hypothetical protein VGX23_20925 [Actinocrinis sp.]|nr:hypothetical protein [Actinocrinis sp.]
MSDAVEVARERLALVPQMVPVYGHRYLPPGRGTYGHPVLSMYQTDIVSYGSDLAEYVVKEFGGAELREVVGGAGGGELRLAVPFWSELM